MATRVEARGDAGRSVHARALQRLAVAISDLSLPDRMRLNDWQRTTMAALLAQLIASIEADLRIHLARHFREDSHPEAHAALIAAHVEIALPILEPPVALRTRGLIALLFRRVEEHRLHRGRPLVAVGGPDGLLAELVRDSDEAVAQAAMDILIRQSRRLDRFEEPLVAGADLPPEVEHELVWTVAAALRTYLVERQRVAGPDADRALADAAFRRLSGYDESDRLESRCLLLSQRLHELGRLDGRFAVRALLESGLPLLLTTLAVRCALGTDAVWEVVSDPAGAGMPLLLRAAQLSRDEAGEILACLAETSPEGDEQLVRQLDLFDGSSLQDSRRALAFWKVDSAYRAAIARLAVPVSEGSRV